MIFAIDGIQWGAAEKLAPVEQLHFKADDRFAEPVLEWLYAKDLHGSAPVERMERISGEGISNRDVAVGIGLAQRATDHSLLTGIGITMRKLGFIQRQVGTARTRKWFQKP